MGERGSPASGVEAGENKESQHGFQLHNDGVLAVIVTYTPELKQLHQLLACLAEQVLHTLVVDNTEGGCPGINDFVSETVSVVVLGQNTGIGNGQNIGIDWAVEKGMGHVLLLDQDSLPSPDMVTMLYQAEQSLVKGGKSVAAVGPQAVFGSERRVEKFVHLSGSAQEKDLCKTQDGEICKVAYLHSSGTLVSVDSFLRVGKLDAGMFIDMLDMEWCFRAAACGMDCYGVPIAEIKHQVGIKKVVGLGGVKRILSIHPPLRTYYQVRNWFLMLKNRHVPKVWLLKYGAKNIFLRFLILLLFIPERKARSLFFLHGLVHGMAGKSGRYKWRS